MRLIAPVPSFRRDVMAVLSHSGCNMGTCHGKRRGRADSNCRCEGDDPAGDFAVLTRDLASRGPTSLSPMPVLLLKPTMQIAHQGGQRFAADSLEYSILRRWIAAGMPGDSPDAVTVTGLTVEPREISAAWRSADCLTAHHCPAVGWPDRRCHACGSVRPVTADCARDLGGCHRVRTVWRDHGHGAVPAPPRSRARRPCPRPTRIRVQRSSRTGSIDRAIFAKLERLKILPAPLCDDVTFLRRASLD